MDQKTKVIRLFSIYNILSVIISIFAWVAVLSGLITIPEVFITQLDFYEIFMALTIFVLAMANIWVLIKTKTMNRPLFLGYLSAQLFVLLWSFLNHGWLFFPTAGSQGTIPALVITLSMFLYLHQKSKSKLHLTS